MVTESKCSFSLCARKRQLIDDVRSCIDRVRSTNPLTHCVTNNVVQEITANVLLAAGASPAMVVDKEEAEAFAQIASGVLVNVGTYRPIDVEAMDAAIRGARAKGTPWVLDPVAVGGLAPRTQYAQKIVTQDHPTVIRGNASEILALAGCESVGKGVDAGDSVDSAVQAARKLAARSGAVVAISGIRDAIYGHGCLARVSGGNAVMTKVVGTGCSLGALVAAYVGANPERPFAATVAAHAHMAAAGSMAAKSSLAPGTFRTLLIDALYELTAQEIVQACDIDVTRDPVDWTLYLVTDPHMGKSSEETIAEQCVKGGACVVQLRDKYSDAASFNAKALQLRRTLQDAGFGQVPIFVNDHVDCAQKFGFNVHIGQRDMSFVQARKVVPAEWMIGLSVSTLEELENAYKECKATNVPLPDVVGIGPVWDTPTKPDASAALGLEGVRMIADRAHELGIACVAIGGINEQTAFALSDAHVDGVCMVSALMNAENPCAAATQMRELL